MVVPVDQLVGKTFGQYQLGQLLGQGGLSSVYAAQQYEPRQVVMLTALTLPAACVGQARERFMARFMHEASSLVRLRHPHIVPLYDFGEHFSYPYLVTPLAEGGSLDTLLKQQERCTPEQTLRLLRQIAEGLDYAHQNNCVHGALKPSNVMIGAQEMVQIAGFGLARILAMQGIGRIQHSHPHLFSISGTFLASPSYLAPEVVQGAPADARSDIYALGIILFEMLTGSVPFTGSDPLQIAMQHVTERMPSLQALAPDVPAALDLVLQRALERDPARRISSAGKLVSAFERVLKMLQAITNPSQPVIQVNAPAAPAPIVNWFAEPSPTNKQWLGTAGTTSAKMPAVGPLSGKEPQIFSPAVAETGKWPRAVPHFSAQVPTVQSNAAAKQGSPQPQEKQPSAWWSMEATPTQPPETIDEPVGSYAGPPKEQPVSVPVKKSRRTVLRATGSVLAVVVLGAGGFGLWQYFTHNGGQPAPAATGKPTAQAHTTAAATQNKATPTAQPMGHTGTVLSDNKMQSNSAKNFVNPADQKDSILVRLPDGNFVAYERACTHEGVAVNYDPNTHRLICPRHQANYDPAKNAAVISGPAPAPLTKVNVKVNPDGMITTA